MKNVPVKKTTQHPSIHESPLWEHEENEAAGNLQAVDVEVTEHKCVFFQRGLQNDLHTLNNRIALKIFQ